METRFGGFLFAFVRVFERAKRGSRTRRTKPKLAEDAPHTERFSALERFNVSVTPPKPCMHKIAPLHIGDRSHPPRDGRI